MPERRKRKSFWDVEEAVSSVNDPNSWSRNERQSNYDGGYIGTISASIPTDKSEQTLWELDDENPITRTSDDFAYRRHDVTEAKEAIGFSRFCKAMSPGFDGIERQNSSNAFDDDQSHFSRYPVPGRRSDRSRSRSLSRDRGREQERAWSRSGNNGISRAETRSCSPIKDYKDQSYGWSDRSRVSDKSSQSCRDFEEGSCRRGSQHRFVNQNTRSYRGVDLVEDDPAESWRNRASHSHMLKHAYGRCSESEKQYDDSESFHGKNKQVISRSRNAFPCKEFVRGNCRRADTCKFSHHITSDDSFGKTSRVRSSDIDVLQQSIQYGKTICKFFAEGKSDRNSIRFSHEDQKSDSLEATDIEVIDHHKSNWSDDAMRMSGAANVIGWGDTPATKTRSAVDITYGILTVDNVRNSLGDPEWKEKFVDSEKQPHPFEGSGRHDRDAHSTESTVKDNMANKSEQLAFLGSYGQNQEVLIVPQNTLLEDNNFSNKTMQQDCSSASRIQPLNHKIVENNRVNQLAPGVFGGEERSENSTLPLISSGSSYLRLNDDDNFLGLSSVTNDSNQGQNMPYPMRSNDFVTDLNVPEVKISALDTHERLPRPHMSMKSIEILHSKAPRVFPNLLNNKNSSQMTNPSAITLDHQVHPVVENPAKLTAQKFLDDMSQVLQAGQPFNSKESMSSFSDALVLAPSINTNTVLPNPVTVSSYVSSSPMENGRDSGESGNFASGTEQNSLFHVKQSSSLSGGIIIDSLMLKDPESENLNQEEVVKSEDNVCDEEINDIEKGKPSDILDVNGKVETLNNNKDGKGIRMFKNTLIEFVKEILKPTWREGCMSREVHKIVVKKVVDKVISTVQVDNLPRTQEKAEHYLSCCKPKITKLVQAYVARCRKKES